MAVTLTIDAETRDLLLNEASMDLKTLWADCPGLDRAGLLEHLERVRFIVGVYDLLGWDDADRDMYEVEVDPEGFTPWLCRLRDDMKHRLGDEMMSLARIERGDVGCFYVDDSQEKSAAMSRQYIAQWQVAAMRFQTAIEQIARARVEVTA